MSLEQVLTGAPENTPTPESAEPVTEQPTPDVPVEPPQGETPATPPVAEPVKTVPLAALEDERRKRQAAEQQLKQQSQPQQPPGFWEQPEQYLSQVEQRAQAIAFKNKLDVCADLASAKYPDLDTRIAEFDELVQRTPGLWQQMMSARNPIEFAYSTAKNHAEYQAAGSVEGLRAKIEAEVRAKVDAEMKAKTEADAKTRAAIPKTLTDVQSGSPRVPEEVDDPPLDAILKKR